MAALLGGGGRRSAGNSDWAARRATAYASSAWRGTADTATIGEAPRPYMYLPLSQHPRSWLTLVVRTRGDPAALIPAVREVVRGLDPTWPHSG